MSLSWTAFVVERLGSLWFKTGEHILMTLVSTTAAIALGVPLAVIAHRSARLRTVVLGLVGLLQTIPSLAMLALLLAALGKIGFLPAIITLTLYALLPIMRNTLTGLEEVPPGVIEAARGIGMTEGQILRIVRLPLALPIIVAGVRTAAVVGVGIATLTAFIGAGGLGDFINRGLALRNHRLILLGAVPAGLLALLVDGSIGAFAWALRKRRCAGTADVALRRLALIAPCLLFAAGVGAVITRPQVGGGTKPVIRVASKMFSEALITANIYALMIEAHTGIAVERRLNLGGTLICHEALVKGEVDFYPEYTGTALTAILKKKAGPGPRETFQIVKADYEDRFDLVWLEPFVLNNTWTLTVRRDVAKKRGWRTISDLVKDAPSLRAGFLSEFIERPDGYRGLQKVYGLNFRAVVDMDAGLMYEATRKGEVDVVCGYATDGRIPAYGLMILDDDKRFFPAYNVAPVFRRDTLERHPAIRRVLAPLGGRLDDATMQRLNFLVDEKKRNPRSVAREWLVKEGLIPDRKPSKGKSR